MRILLISLLLLQGCKTPEQVSLPRVEQTQASFDGNEQNSGLVGYTKEHGFEITVSARDRYLALVKEFGSAPIGLSELDGKIYMTKEGMVEFMNSTDKKNNK